MSLQLLILQMLPETIYYADSGTLVAAGANWDVEIRRVNTLTMHGLMLRWIELGELSSPDVQIVDKRSLM